MDWLDRWKARRRQAAATRTADRLLAWGQASGSILRKCQSALDDEQAGTGDIGQALDRLDRELHSLKDTASALPAVLRTGHAELGRTAAGITDDLYRLRNLTAQYLIRAQGPTPPFLEGDSPDEAARDEHRKAAFRQVGGEARRLAAELDDRLRAFDRLAAPLKRPPEDAGHAANQD